MAEIFLSYANEDRETAGKVAALLESAGWTVWWDRRIPAGRTWRSVLEDALTQMRCMVVLWSRNSVDSHWVKEEAEEARAVEKLVPVLIEPVNPPVGFRSIQAADLTNWDGSRATEGSRQLIADLRSLLGEPQRKTENATEPRRQGRSEAQARRATYATEHPSQHSHSETAPLQQQRLQVASRTRPLVPWLITGTVAAAILVGTVWFWPRWQEPAPPLPVGKIETENQAPAELSLVQLTISAPRSRVMTRETMPLRLEAEYSDGTKREIKEPIVWTSSDPRIASIEADGQVKALEAGTVKITGRYGRAVSSPLTVSIQAPQQAVKTPEPIKLVSLAVSGARRELRVGGKLALRVKANYSDGSWNTFPAGVDWQSSDRSIASVNASGELEALRAGETEITARAGAVSSPPISIRIAEAPKKAATEAPQAKTPATTFHSPEAATPDLYPAPPAQPSTEALAARVAPYMTRAKSYRVQGNYAAALAELEKARAIDPTRPEIRLEVEQTRKACNAEKSLGYNVNC